MLKYVWLLALALAAAGLGCDDKSKSTPAASTQPSMTKVRLALNWKPEPQFGGFYQADIGGAFAAEGLAVEIIPGGSGTPTAQIIDAGRADFGIVSADELVTLRSRGGELVALFAVYQTNPQGILCAESRGATSIESLLKSGGTLAIQRGLPYADFLEKKYGFGNVKVVPYTGGLPVLNDPMLAQQCFVTSEPILARQKGLAVRSFLIAESGYNPYTTVVATKAGGDKALAARMTRAVRAGWNQYLADPSKANEVMGKLNPAMDAATFAASAEAQKPLIATAETTVTAGLGTMTLDRWKTLCGQLVELKVIPTAPDAATLFVP